MATIVRETPRIADLPALVSALPPAERELFYRLFDVRVSHGELHPLESIHPWLMKQFGSVASIFRQRIVRVTNRVTGDGALFDELRARRPLDVREQLTLKAQVLDGLRHDPLSQPLTETPENPFGRVWGKHYITDLSLVTPPLKPTGESWQGFPILARVVDRGDPQSRASDMATMELYASPVIAAAPFVVGPFLEAP